MAKDEIFKISVDKRQLAGIVGLIQEGGSIETVFQAFQRDQQQNLNYDHGEGVESMTARKESKHSRSSDNKIAPMPSSYNVVLGREGAAVFLFAELMKPMKEKQVGSPPVCDTELAMATQGDVTKVAEGILSITIMPATTDVDPVTKCLTTYPMLRELNTAHPEHFERLLAHIIARILEETAKQEDAQLRLFFGAALSTFDTATDMYMIYEFYEAGAGNYARAMIYSFVHALQAREEGLSVVPSDLRAYGGLCRLLGED